MFSSAICTVLNDPRLLAKRVAQCIVNSTASTFTHHPSPTSVPSADHRLTAPEDIRAQEAAALRLMQTKGTKEDLLMKAFIKLCSDVLCREAVRLKVSPFVKVSLLYPLPPLTLPSFVFGC